MEQKGLPHVDKDGNIVYAPIYGAPGAFTPTKGGKGTLGVKPGDKTESAPDLAGDEKPITPNPKECTNRAVKGPMTTCGCESDIERRTTCMGFNPNSNGENTCIHFRFEEFCTNEKLQAEL
jgi:hypothetical protein